MPAVRPIGGYFPLDAAGYVVNPCTPPAPGSRLGQMLTIATQHAQSVFPNTLHSVWLRGSYARGTATPDSDLDLVLLVRDETIGRWSEARGAENIRQKLSEQFAFTRPVEWMASHFTVGFAARSPRLAMVLATQAVPIYGPDVRSSLGRYAPGPALQIYLDHWSDDYHTFLARDPVDTAAVRAIAKAALRSAFETVMAEYGRFTTDLFYCAAACAACRPELARVVWLVLYYYVNPTEEMKFLRIALAELDLMLR